LIVLLLLLRHATYSAPLKEVMAGAELLVSEQALVPVELLHKLMLPLPPLHARYELVPAMAPVIP